MATTLGSPKLLPDSIFPHPGAAPSSALHPCSLPSRGTKPVLREAALGEQVSAAEAAVLCAASPRIHLRRPDSAGLFGAKHCAIKWR